MSNVFFSNEQILEAYEKLKNAKYCFGITSDTNIKYHHVLFFDFDGEHKLFEIIDSLKNVQRRYGLSTIYVLKSSNGFNAFCLSVRPMREVINILSDTNLIDDLFVRLGYEKNNRFILRMDLDKKPVYRLTRNNTGDV